MIKFEDELIHIELENGIVVLSWKVTFADIGIVKKMVDTRLSLSKGTSSPMLVNLASLKTITKGARDFLASEKGCEDVTAAAILTESAVTRIIANFFIKINKPLVPTKLFTDQEEAKKWLAKYIIP